MTLKIYGLNDPITGECRYVGCSSNPDVRLRQHLQRSHSWSNQAKVDWIAQLESVGLSPILEILEIVQCGEKSADRELFWITKKSGRLFNKLTPSEVVIRKEQCGKIASVLVSDESPLCREVSSGKSRDFTFQLDRKSNS